MRNLRPVGEWKSMFSRPTGRLLKTLQGIYGSDPGKIGRHLRFWTEALDGFARNYSPNTRVFIARACGRINLLGMHIDHRGGSVNAMALGDTIFVAEPRDDDVVRLRNANPEFPPDEFSIARELPADGVEDWDKWTIEQYNKRLAAGLQAHWGNYVRAGVLYLQQINTAPGGAFSPVLKGMNVFVNSSVPLRSGLSSSSSIVVATMEACIHVNQLPVSDMELVDAAHLAEWYVGTRGGGGDHAAIKFSRHGYLAHLGLLPLTVDLIPFPNDYCAILCDSKVVAAKTAGARNLFNQRVACYELGMLILRRSFPHLAGKMKLLRDVNPSTLGVDKGDIYQMFKALPESADREEISALLADQPDELERIYRSHEPVADGYRIRQVCMYGVAECLRSEQAGELLRSGDIESFGRLITLSHDGDRVTNVIDGERVALSKPLSDAELDRLTCDVRSDDAARRDLARLYRRPGGYDASCPQLDEMVDLAIQIPGVLGAGLVGAGLGGCIVILASRDRAEQVVATMGEKYYRPRALPVTAKICLGVGGSGVLDLD